MKQNNNRIRNIWHKGNAQNIKVSSYFSKATLSVAARDQIYKSTFSIIAKVSRKSATPISMKIEGIAESHKEPCKLMESKF